MCLLLALRGRYFCCRHTRNSALQLKAQPESGSPQKEPTAVLDDGKGPVLTWAVSSALWRWLGHRNGEQKVTHRATVPRISIRFISMFMGVPRGYISTILQFCSFHR